MQISATEFKAKCLQLIDHVAETGEPIVITKHGKPKVRLEPDTGLVAERPLPRKWPRKSPGCRKAFIATRRIA